MDYIDSSSWIVNPIIKRLLELRLAFGPKILPVLRASASYIELFLTTSNAPPLLLLPDILEIFFAF